jgi:LAO/AO transport system kinase
MSYSFKRNRYTIQEYVDGIINGNRIMLSKTITLIESKLPSDNEIAEQVIHHILPKTGNSIRIGITGIPGAGKSTFIESFGKHLTSINKKVAVLSIDPSSQLTQGSILGDKTRMEQLSNDPNAFIRPSASGDKLGGVHSKTREAMLLCEAAGFDVIIIETVGVGQSETTVKNMVDFFLLVLIAGGGDELQGIKRGIVEVADAIVINKADGDNILRADLSKRAYQNALHMLSANDNNWLPKVLTCSAINQTGIEEVWKMICDYEQITTLNGWFTKQRQKQNTKWMFDVIFHQLHQNFLHKPQVNEKLQVLEQHVCAGKVTPIEAARQLLQLYYA